MKNVQPNLENTLKLDHIQNLRSVNLLRNYWGEDTVNGVSIMKHRQYYFPDNQKIEEKRFKQLFKFLGAYEDVSTSNFKGMRSAWMYFNKNKGSSLAVNYNDFVSDNLNRLWWDDNDGPRPDGLTLTASIVINAKTTSTLDSVRLKSVLNPSMTQSEAIQAVIDNYEYLWDKARITHEGVGVINKGSIVDPVNKIETPDEDDLTPDDPWLSTIVRYALRNAGIPCTVKNLEIGSINYTGNKVSTYNVSYVLDIEIPYNAFSPSNLFVQTIAADLAFEYGKITNSNSYLTKSAIQSMNSTDLEDDNDLVTRDYILWESVSSALEAKYESLWYSDGNSWYLRYEPFQNPKAYGFTHKELSEYVLSTIDTGYKKKKVKWYKKFAAVVLVVVAFILALPSGGSSLTLLTVATAIVAASLILTLVILAFSLLGMTEWASAFSEVSKWIEPLVIIATLIIVVNGVMTAYAEAAGASADAGLQQTTAEIIGDMVVNQIESLVDNIVKGATDLVTGNILSSTSLMFTNKLLKIVNMGFEMKLKSINKKNEDLKSQYDKLMEEMTRETDSLQGFAKIYGKPATADWSMYSSIFDMPYERGGGLLSLGNIQRTTKQATRKADYNDSVFSDILIM